MGKTRLNPDVTSFLDNHEHPFRKEIEALRICLLQAAGSLTENIKWNAPNYSMNGQDRITMRIFPPKQVQLIFHCGAVVKAQPSAQLITDKSGLLAWRGNDRAVASFKNMSEIEKNRSTLEKIIRDWIEAAS